MKMFKLLAVVITALLMFGCTTDDVIDVGGTGTVCTGTDTNGFSCNTPGYVTCAAAPGCYATQAECTASPYCKD